MEENKPPIRALPLNYQSPMERDRGRIFRWPFFAAFPFTWAYWFVFIAFMRVVRFVDPTSLFWLAFAGLICIGVWSYRKRSRAFGAGVLTSIILTPVIIVLVIFGICYFN
jgi:hypothetical protein